MLGKTLLHYEILGRLGAGGMGEVYLARDTKLRREVAIKVLPPQLSSDPGRLERFRREASVVAALNHPNIVTVHSVEVVDELHFFTMEHIDGQTLSSLIPEDGLPAADFFTLALPLTAALTAAHQRGVTHRDLKPGNIMVTGDGWLKVLDFGLAKLQIADEPAAATDSRVDTELLTGEGEVLGTTPYMAPEQLKGQPADSRSDVFALGTILYTMATGRHPFRADSPAEVISSILSHAPARVSSVNPDLPDELGSIVGRCLEKDPSQRFQDAAELKAALDALATPPETGEGATVRLPSPPAPVPTRGRWRSRPGLAVLIVAIVVASALGIRHLAFSRPPDLRSLAVLPFANLSGDGELDQLADAVSAGLVNALGEIDGLQVARRSEAWVRPERSPDELRRELGVGGVVDGEIQSVGSTLHTSVSLTDTSTGFILWSHTYIAGANEAYHTQRAIARDLETYLSIPLSGDGRRIARDPDGRRQAHDYFVAGRRFLDLEDDPRAPDAAAENFRQALRIDPDFALARAGLSDALWRIHHRDRDPQVLAEAEAEARAALDIDPDLPSGHVALARVRLSAGHHEDAIDELEKVLARHPRPDEAHRELARSYEKVGELADAESAYRAAAALRPGSWSNWNALGTFLARLGRYDEARTAFERAADLAPPQVHRPREQLATYLLAVGRFDEAIDAYERIPVENRGPALASNLGTAYFFSERPEKWRMAERSYLAAVRLSPKDALYHANLGDLYNAVGRPDEARRRYLRARSLIESETRDDPDNPALLAELADYSAKGGDCDTARSLVHELADTLPDTGPNAHQQAYIHAMCGDDDAAVAAIRRAIALGEPPEVIRHENEFRPLRSRSDFRALVGEAEPTS